MKYLNLATSLLAVVLLNGCLEVEDNSSDVKALLDQAENSISIKGVVVDALDLKPIGNALITVKVGSTDVISNFEVTDGDFELTGLPRSSDIDIIISSPDNKFLSRTFFTQTALGSKDSIEDVGSFAVSESVDVEVSVIDNETGNALSTLEFVGYSHSGTNSSAYKYQHVSSFNIETGIYTITLPKFINTSISANLDFDKDGEVDYVPELSTFLRGRNIYIGSANTKEFSRIHVNEVPLASEHEIRLSLVDESAEPLLGATFYIEDSVVDSVYDESTSQYVIITQIKDTVSFQLPAFTSNDIKYQSSSFTVSKLVDGNLSIRKNGGSSNCCFVIPSSNVIDLALAPQVITENETSLEVVLAATEVNPLDSSFSVFYSQAIEVLAENILLTNARGFTVLRGNEDANDLILPGTTVITTGISIPVTFVLSLTDTRLKVTPISSLTQGEVYTYTVKSVMNKVTLESANISNDDLTFTIDANEDDIFSVSDIKLDNENFTTNGNAITANNSAGDASNPLNSQRNVMLYLPASIHSLQNLTLRQVFFVRNGISSVSIENYNVVTDGNVNVSAVGIVNLANNENLVREGRYPTIITSSAQVETQKVYRMRTGPYLSDNTGSESNTITYEYAYETKAGEISTGNITIPVQ